MIRHRQKKQDFKRAERQGTELAALEKRHEREMNEFSRHYRALSRVEKRETHSLETAIRRDTLLDAVHAGAREAAKRQAVITRLRDKLPAREVFNERAPGREAKSERSETIEGEPIREVFNDKARAEERQEIDKQKGKAKGKPPKVTEIFREQAKQPEPVSPLQKDFRDAGKDRQPANDSGQETRRRRRNRDRDFDLER